uniref:RING-type E3 ubiquitin transferase n=1 Tax=Lepeophtheirus salmonis TaxID=72036 RepID=A0A0K2V986_LEPSM
MEDETGSSGDLCRVCRSEGGSERPLFHPCICTGSIKFIHEECLLQWLKYSKKEICELCNHRFSFTSIYSSDMPKRLPVRILLSGLCSTLARVLKVWVHDTCVALAWIGLLPLTACRIYRSLFSGSLSSIICLPLHIFSTENLTSDISQGCVVVFLTLLAFIGLFWLKDQMLHGGGPEWLDMEDNAHLQHQQPEQPNPQQDDPPPAEDPPDANQQEVEEVEQEENVPVEPAAPEILDPAEAPHPDDGQWNPMEWDRPPEEMTWERIFGFDGSLVFLEHVFWAISLNTLFILIFAFFPYHIGHFTILGFELKSFIGGTHFEGMLTTLYGYCISGVSLVVIHSITSILKLRKVSRFLGQCYVVVKVALLLVVEIFVFPVVCGWWLDICSLSLFDATLKDRQASYHKSPETSLFMHWLIGMIYVFYFASFVILLREILRPGVLWFIRNLNDPDFNPIQEMIHLSVLKHLRRFCASLVMFGTSILVMLYIPSRIIKHYFVNFLPYQTAQPPDSPVDELIMELFLVLVILPALQDHNNMREWLKRAIRLWCLGASGILDLKSYLFGDEVDAEGDKDDEDEQDDNVPIQEVPPPAQPPNEEGGLRAAHQAFHFREGPTRYQSYDKPRFLPAKIMGLFVLMLLSWLIVSLIGMLVPVWFGRKLFGIWLRDNRRFYELYTLALGLFVCLSLIKGITLFVGWISQGWKQLSITIREWGLIGLKALIAVFLLMIVIPLMAGVLLELVLLMPLRVPLHQTPVYILWQDLAFGVLYTKIVIGLTRIGPDWWLKAAIIRLCNDGIRGLDLKFLIMSIIMPVCTYLGLSLSVPYIIAHSIAPLLFSDQMLLIVIQRYIYTFCLSVIVTVFFVNLQLDQFKKLYEHIKNDRYLIGKRLVNYNHAKRSSTLQLSNQS